MQSTTENGSSLSLKEQVAKDLDTKLSEFNDQKKGLKVMAMLMGIHEKTLKRLLSQENKPGHQTVFKIYRVLCHTQNDSQLLGLVPNVVKEFLVKAHPRGMNDTVQYTLDIETQLQKDPVFCEIYFLCGSGSTTKEYISFHYGRYGERVLEKMISMDIVALINKNELTLGTNQASLNVETLHKAALHLIERFFKSENTDNPGENYIGLFAQGLNDEAYNRWLEIDKEAERQKMEIARNSKNHGTNKAFTFSITETLKEPKKDSLH